MRTKKVAAVEVEEEERKETRGENWRGAWDQIFCVMFDNEFLALVLLFFFFFPLLFVGIKCSNVFRPLQGPLTSGDPF